MSKNKDELLILAVILLLIGLRLAGFHFSVILTDSMEPTIKPGYIVVTAPPYLVHPHRGDIILYKVELGGRNFTIMHRIIGEFEKNGETYFVTKGDNRKFPDQWFVPEKNVIGVYLFSIPYVGYILILSAKYYFFYAGIVISVASSFIAHIIIIGREKLWKQTLIKSVKRERETLRVVMVKRMYRGR